MNTYKILKDNIETIYLGNADGSLLEIERKYFEELVIIPGSNSFLVNVALCR